MIALTALASLSVPAIADEAPADMASRFCALQSAGDTPELRAMLTRPLLAIIAEAEERNATIVAGAPDEKPPLGDGIPYRSFPDGAPTCAVGSVDEAANGAIVDVFYSIPGSTGGDWTDRLVLRPDGGELRIDDILFQSFPTDTYQAGLRRFFADSFDF